MVQAKRVLIVEHRAAVREAVASELERESDFEIVGRAASAEARQVLGSVDVVIVDVGLPDGSGADRVPDLRAANPNAHAGVPTASYDPAPATKVMEHGVSAGLARRACFAHESLGCIRTGAFHRGSQIRYR